MKRLIVMRHAKSDWASGPSGDHDRPLNPRGRSAAASLGDWLRDADMLPDLVLCSSARRTRETCDLLALPETTQVRHSRDLYLADPGRILQVLRTAKGETVLILGHNPGIAAFAEAVLDSVPDYPQFIRYPTGATLVADVDIASWADMDWGIAAANEFIVPRELP